MATRHSGQEGFALVLVLLALTLLTALASTALAAAVGQLRAASMAGRLLSERTAAGAAVDATLNTTRGVPTSPVGDSAVELTRKPLGRTGWRRVVNLRLTTEIHVFLGEATLDSGVPARDARLVWWMHPETRIAAHAAAVEAGTIDIETGADVLTHAIVTGRPGIPSCDHLPLLSTAFAGTPVPVASGLPSPPEWGSGGDGPDFAGVRLGWFGRRVLQQLADHPVTAGGSPPAVGCTGCWSGLVYSDGSTQVTRQGAGVLVVNGDLGFAPGSSWIGLVLVAGEVTVHDSARIQGLMRAGGRVTLKRGSVVDGSACSALNALQAADSLSRPLPLPGRSRLAPLAPASR